LKSVSFEAEILLEGINPYVDAPLDTGKMWRRKGNIPVRIELDGERFLATLVPLGSKRTPLGPGRLHRLYLNGVMRTKVGKDVGDRVQVSLSMDNRVRRVPMVPALAREFRKDLKAKAAFEQLAPSRRKEVLRYLGSLKSDEAVERNVLKVMRTLRSPRSSGRPPYMR
jgi:hypothetical protein